MSNDLLSPLHNTRPAYALLVGACRSTPLHCCSTSEDSDSLVGSPPKRKFSFYVSSFFSEGFLPRQKLCPSSIVLRLCVTPFACANSWTGNHAFLSSHSERDFLGSASRQGLCNPFKGIQISAKCSFRPHCLALDLLFLFQNQRSDIMWKFLDSKEPLLQQIWIYLSYLIFKLNSSSYSFEYWSKLLLQPTLIKYLI